MAKSKFKPRNTEKENKPAESKVKDKISKKRRPVKKSEQSLNIKARKAFGAGEVILEIKSFDLNGCFSTL